MVNAHERFRNIFHPSFYKKFRRACKTAHICEYSLFLQLIETPNNGELFKHFLHVRNDGWHLYDVFNLFNKIQTGAKDNMKRNIIYLKSKIIALKCNKTLFDENDLINFICDCNAEKYIVTDEMKHFVMKYGLDKSLYVIIKIGMFSLQLYEDISDVTNSSKYYALHHERKKIKQTITKNWCSPYFNLIDCLLHFWHTKPIGCIKSIMQKSQTTYPTCIGDILFADEHIVKNIILFL